MPRIISWLLAVFLLAGLSALFFVHASRDAPANPGAGTAREESFYSSALAIGNGQVRTYAQVRGGKPVSLGFVLTRDVLLNLPTARSDGKHCYDRDHNDQIDPNTECLAEHEFVLDLPKQFTTRIARPFTWAMLNWDPYGHAPDHVYGVPHFDFHFYMQDRAATKAIRTGPCGGPNLINCDDYQTGQTPLSQRYTPAGYVDIEAVVPGMGNHLGDQAAHEFHGSPFTHTFMYGVYGGAVTFYEPMIAKSWLEQLAGAPANSCTPIKQPAAWQSAGWYPTTYCIEYHPSQQHFTVSLRDFVLRPAT